MPKPRVSTPTDTTPAAAVPLCPPEHVFVRIAEAMTRRGLRLPRVQRLTFQGYGEPGEYRPADRPDVSQSILGLTLDNGDDLAAWAAHMGARVNPRRVDAQGGIFHTADGHWLGWAVQLFAYYDGPEPSDAEIEAAARRVIALPDDLGAREELIWDVLAGDVVTDRAALVAAIAPKSPAAANRATAAKLRAGGTLAAAAVLVVDDEHAGHSYSDMRAVQDGTAQDPADIEPQTVPRLLAEADLVLKPIRYSVPDSADGGLTPAMLADVAATSAEFARQLPPAEAAAAAEAYRWDLTRHAGHVRPCLTGDTCPDPAAPGRLFCAGHSAQADVTLERVTEVTCRRCLGDDLGGGHEFDGGCRAGLAAAEEFGNVVYGDAVASATGGAR